GSAQERSKMTKGDRELRKASNSHPDYSQFWLLLLVFVEGIPLLVAIAVAYIKKSPSSICMTHLLDNYCCFFFPAVCSGSGLQYLTASLYSLLQYRTRLY
uniref:Uncharacterized protein n=1 Tax=Parascaris univalens TaxID=6257 RepID=A0A915CIX2_PARUN